MIEHAGAQSKDTATATLIPWRGSLLQRKCACGGSAGLSSQCNACQTKKLLGLQTKLAVGEPADVYEREADRIADQVMATLAHPGVSSAPLRIQRFSGQSNGQVDAAPASVDQALTSTGRSLEPALRQDMEQRFGHDFSRVRVHSGTAAEQSARDVNALAYTVGPNIVFGAGRFAPGSREGWRLIAHELTHVAQQSGADGVRTGQNNGKRGLSPISLQRKCACGGSSVLAGECGECSKKGQRTAQLAATNSTPADASSIRHNGSSAGHESFRQPVQTNSGHDFSRVRIHSQLHGAPTQSTSVDGAAAISSGGAFDGIFIDGPDKGTTPKPAAPQPAPKPKTPPAKAANCPTNVQVINIDPLTDSQFGKNGTLTGIGAVAYMEVSDSGGKEWDGTIVQETVKQTKNTCGARARKVCSNESGESGGFKVGAETNLLGKAKMPALRNTFYDLHVFTREVSILHELGKSECEIQCQQSYQCGGKQFGPEFIITYMTKKDTIAKTYDVTRITVKKEAKATQAAAPANP